MPGVSCGPSIPTAGINVKAVIKVGGSITPASRIGIIINTASITGVVSVIRNSSLLGVYVLVI